MQNLNKLLLNCKNKNLSENEIIKFKDDISIYSKESRKTISNDNYLLFLNTLGYAYRLNDSSQRLYYTFNEAVSAVDIANLTNDNVALGNYTYIYSMVLDICISDFLKENINKDEVEKAINQYKKFEEEKSKENKKYHQYQY